LGVPQSAMNVTGVGQNDLKVPTPDGVREAQNRRTEIVLGGAAAPPPPPPPAGPSQ
jgi:outer membrane protein OmpA-like peptidoglycan-associated protein